MNDTLKKILKPVASLRLTVVLLFMSMLLVYAGTSAQKEMGVWEVQHWYFHCYLCFIPFKYLLPLSDWWWQHARVPLVGGHAFSGFWFPGGYVLIAALLLNLLSAHAVRFKFAWKRSGILLIHFGLILLLVGEVLTSQLAAEAVMSLNNGQSQQYADDIRDVELAIVDPSQNTHDTVTVISASRLKQDALIHDARLPFDIRVDEYDPNATIVGPMQAAGVGAAARGIATAGPNAKLWLKKETPFSGVGEDAEKLNTPGAFLTFLDKGKSLGTFLVKADSVPAPWTLPQPVEWDGKTYQVQLRYKRIYKPYTIKLIKFTHETYLGTDMAQNFASRIQLLDPEHGVDREVVISMNHPLRYHNDTIYQQKFNMMMGGEEGTVLQIVNNPNWLMPYFSVVIGGLGLLIHFGLTLNNFLTRRSVESSRRAQTGYSTSPRRSAGVGSTDSYTLKPAFPWLRILPASAVVVAFMVVVSFFATAMSVQQSNSFDLDELGKLPVWDQGRAAPLDTLARNTLKIINGKQTFEAEVEGQKDKTETLPAIRWMVDVLARPDVAAQYKVFRVDNEDIKGMLGLKADAKRFSWNDLFGGDNDNAAKLQKQYEQSRNAPEKDRDAYQSKVIELYGHATTYLRWARGADYALLYDYVSHPEQAKDLETKAESFAKIEPGKQTLEQRKLLENYQGITSALRDLTLPERLKSDTSIPAGQRGESSRQADEQRKQMDLYLAAPPIPTSDPDKHWVGLGQSVLDFRKDGTIAPTASAFFGLLKDYRDGKPEDFKSDLDSYERTVHQTAPKATSKAAFEVFFSRLDLFTICLVFYVTIFLLVCGYWLTGARAFSRSAISVVVLTFLVHTVGLACRIYISGRPPVTNLYSSALFIAWGAVALSIGLELIFRNGIGSAVAAMIGFGSLLVADGLAQRDPNTMGQLQAVLDTNFWLATHVVCVTLGYASTFLAGIIAIVYVVGNLLSGGMAPETRKDITRMTYGIICFALLFSFVGTILGGIWADQSWGRFWGWDPKENGAVLIVLWNALILHARWGGVIREKGIALLAIFGNVITSWSWFGTNMLGIGLHSYGFMGHAFFWLCAFVISQLLVLIAGICIPRSWLASGSPPPVPVRP